MVGELTDRLASETNSGARRNLAGIVSFHWEHSNAWKHVRYHLKPVFNTYHWTPLWHYMTGRKEIELPQSLLFFLRVCESCVLRMKILVAFYGLLLASYLRTIFGRPTLNSTSEIDMMATLQRSKREFQESDYDDYYNDLELEILESRKELLEKTFLPPDLPLSSSVKNNIQLLKETTKNAPEYMMDLYKSYSEKKVSRPSSDIVRSFMNINIAGGLQLHFLTIPIFEIIEKILKLLNSFIIFWSLKMSFL